MSVAAENDLNVVAGERFDLIYQWKQANGTPMPMTGFTAVMVIYAGDDPLLASTQDFILTQEPSGATGQLVLYFGGEMTGSLLTPYEQDPDFYSYRLDLVDNLADDNIIPLLTGNVIVGRK